MTDEVTVPAELLVEYGPDRATKLALENMEKVTVCGGHFAVEWTTGPWKGLWATAFCWRPGCIETGRCTGARFIPHLEQWTLSRDDPNTKRRKMSAEEGVALIRVCARKATGRDDPRSDRQILVEVREVHEKMMQSLRSSGGWSL